jgi:hypothetical protein
MGHLGEKPDDVGLQKSSESSRNLPATVRGQGTVSFRIVSEGAEKYHERNSVKIAGILGQTRNGYLPKQVHTTAATPT